MGTTPTPAPGPPLIDRSGPIRRYLDEGINRKIDGALATLPPGDRFAVIAYAYNGGFRLSHVGKHKELLAWTVAVDLPWDGRLAPEVEAAARISF